MKTLTLRLNDAQSNLVDSYMQQFGINTASKALVDALERAWSDQVTIAHMQQQLDDYKAVIDGLSTARDTFTAVLNHLDQKPLF